MKKLVLALAVIGSMTGCATVKPWERGNLTKTEMSFNSLSASAIESTHYERIEFIGKPMVIGGQN